VLRRLAGGSVRTLEAKGDVAHTDASNATHDFTFTSEAAAKIEVRFQPPVTLASDTKNFTIAVDIASWFKNASGGRDRPNQRRQRGGHRAEHPAIGQSV
jgi:hypothetical protein